MVWWSLGRVLVSGEVEKAVKKDLKLFGREAEESGLGAAAIALAREIDRDNSATSKSMCAKALQDVLGQLRGLAPPRRERDRIDELSEKRGRRRATA